VIRRSAVVIVDTHAALWFLAEDGRLSSMARSLIEDAGVERRLSAISVWEVAVKRRVGKLRVSPDFHHLLYEQGLHSLPVTEAYAREIAELPLHHRDPFDRMLVAQARVEGSSLLSADQRLRSYDVPVLW
jgi:PIN domain nuclease of toxin-antitoxin system